MPARGSLNIKISKSDIEAAVHKESGEKQAAVAHTPSPEDAGKKFFGEIDFN